MGNFIAKLNNKNIIKIFILFIFLSIITNFVFAENDEVIIKQVVNNNLQSIASTTTQNYSAGLAYSSTNTVYPINYETQVVFTTNQTGKIPEPIKPGIPSGYFVPDKNEFIIVNNTAPKTTIASSTNYAISTYDEKDLCHNVPGVQTQIEKGWIQNTYNECFFVLGNTEVIRFSFVPDKYIYPVDYAWLRKIIRFFSAGAEDKNLISDPNPTQNIYIDLTGSVIYLGTLLLIPILFITTSRAIYHNKNIWKTN